MKLTYALPAAALALAAALPAAAHEQNYTAVLTGAAEVDLAKAIEAGTEAATLLADGKPRSAGDLELLADLSTVMRDASICGLGQAAPNPVDCVIKYFPGELQA